MGARNKHYMSSQEDVTNEIEAAENIHDVSVFDNEIVNKTEVSKVAFSYEIDHPKINAEYETN